MLLRVLRSFFAGDRGAARPAPEAGTAGDSHAIRQRLSSAARLHSAGDMAGARAIYREVLGREPGNADAHHMLGLLEFYCGNHDTAQASIHRAIALAPGYAVLHRHLGMVLEHQGDLQGAVESCGRALALDPTDSETHGNLGNVLVAAHRIDEAVASYRRAIELDPGSPRFKFNLSLALLLQGHYAEGWEKYEFRWDGAAELAGRRRDFSEPQWRGEPLGARTILLHAEQAFGDSLQFARYAALVARRNEGARVLLECQPELKRLFQSIRNRVEIVAQGEPLPPFDVHCPLLSLPFAFGTTIETIPAGIPYFHADPSEVDRWRQRLQPAHAFSVGLVWSGKARRMNQWHNLALADFGALFDVPGVRFFSLQKNQTGYAFASDCAGMPSLDHAAHTAITCTVCHTAHEKTTYGSQLRNPTYSTNFFSYSTSTNTDFVLQYKVDINICGQCHNQRGGTWTGTGRPPHHSPQYNMLIGNIGDVKIAGVDLSGSPQSSHRDIAKQCTHCHTHSHGDESPSEEEPVYTGHAFEPLPENCVPCHTVEEAENFIIFRQRNTRLAIAEVKTQLDTWGETKSPEPLRAKYGKLAWEFTTAGQLSQPTNGPAVSGPTGSEQSLIADEIKKSRFLLYMVEHDASYGVHNARFSTTVLTEAKKLVDGLLQAP